MGDDGELRHERGLTPGATSRPAVAGVDRGALGVWRRVFHDGSGQLWTVAEEAIPPEERTPGDDAAEAMGFRAAWLVFSSGPVRRRLLLYPRQWYALATAELERLCARARRVLDD